jgi:hypothetical protein
MIILVYPITTTVIINVFNRIASLDSKIQPSRRGGSEMNIHHAYQNECVVVHALKLFHELN